MASQTQFYNLQNFNSTMNNKKQSQPNPTYAGNGNNRRSTQSSSRAVQNQSVSNQNKERLGSANRQRNLTQDSKQSVNNWAKQKDQQLLNLVKEYLQKNGYNRAFQVLKTERPVKRVNAQNHNLPSQKQQENKSAAIQAFDNGEREQFFKIASKIFQSNDQTIRKLQFECQIYFCIHAIHPSVKKSTTISQKSKDAFRKYLETKGAEITSNHQEFLSFYALPYIPKPQQQPSLAHVFTKDWLNKMRGKILDEVSVLNANNKSTSSVSYGTMGGRRVSALQEFFYNQTQNLLKEKEEGGKENSKYILENEQLKQQNKELLQYIQIAQDHYKSFSEASKNNLIQSNVKWFQFSRQLLGMIKKAVNGQKIQNVQKYQAFLGRSVEQLIYGTNDVSLFEKNSYFTEEVSINPTDNRNLVQKRQIQQLVCQIDLAKVTNFLLEAYKPQKQVMVCLVLKALKDRFLQLKSPYARREIIISYSRHDICGISEQNYKVQKTLLLQSSERVKQFYLRLLNYITTDFYGITYLSGSSKLIENIIGIFGTEHQFSISRKYVLGILQRFSLLKNPQNQMISFGLIPIILKIFRNERQQLSEYSIQYLTALIMNLSLRRSSKTHFEKSKGQVVSILLPLLNTEDPMVKDYVNGALYSLIQASHLIKKEALNQQAVDKINTIIQETQEKIKYEECDNQMQKADYSTLLKQYHYILDALTGQNQIGDQTGISDSEEDDEQRDLDDIDDHDEDERLSIQSDQNQYIENQDQYLKGQELLLKQFALLGPQAIREQLLTRSVLDETSRRIQNMTASINRSRRIDNIFAQQRPGTPSLLPELDRSMIPSKIRD